MRKCQEKPACKRSDYCKGLKKIGSILAYFVLKEKVEFRTVMYPHLHVAACGHHGFVSRFVHEIEEQIPPLTIRGISGMCGKQ